MPMLLAVILSSSVVWLRLTGSTPYGLGCAFGTRTQETTAGRLFGAPCFPAVPYGLGLLAVFRMA